MEILGFYKTLWKNNQVFISARKSTDFTCNFYHNGITVPTLGFTPNFSQGLPALAWQPFVKECFFHKLGTRTLHPM